MDSVTKTSQKSPTNSWPKDWETASLTDEQFAVKGLMHWSVPEDMAIDYVEKLGWQKAYALDLEASEGFTDGGLKNPRAYVRSLVKDELLIV